MGTLVNLRPSDAPTRLTASSRQSHLRASRAVLVGARSDPGSPRLPVRAAISFLSSADRAASPPPQGIWNGIGLTPPWAANTPITSHPITTGRPSLQPSDCHRSPCSTCSGSRSPAPGRPGLTSCNSGRPPQVDLWARHRPGRRPARYGSGPFVGAWLCAFWEQPYALHHSPATGSFSSLGNTTIMRELGPVPL